MKYLFSITFIFITFIVFAQRPSQNVIKEDKYLSPTEWSCIDNHFGYYYIKLQKSLPYNLSDENYLRSFNFDLGYSYRFTIINLISIGGELAYQRDLSVITEEKFSIFDPSSHYNKISFYSNNIHTGIFFRVNFFGADYRNLGFYLDAGFSTDFAISNGTKYVHESKFIYEKIKFKNPDYLHKNYYGVFLRIGYNNFATIINIKNSDWIKGFNNTNYKRSILGAAIVFNLYRK